MHTAVPLIPPLYYLVFLLISLINKVLLQCTPFEMHTDITCTVQVELKQLLNFLFFEILDCKWNVLVIITEVLTGFVQI